MNCQSIYTHWLHIHAPFAGFLTIRIFSVQAPIVQKLDSAIQRINDYPVDKF